MAFRRAHEMQRVCVQVSHAEAAVGSCNCTGGGK
jgi:hypothetical protein